MKKDFVKKIYKKILPKTIKDRIWELKNYMEDKQKRNIIKFLKNNNENQDQEKVEILNYLKHNGKKVFPYHFIEKYHQEDIAVYTDSNNSMKYLIHCNKRMYFPMDWNVEKIQKYYNGLLIEQDIESPHRYEYGNFCVENGDVVADIGAAEGIFSLSIIEKARKIYLFECDEAWTNALKQTFEPYNDKVVLVNKFISDTNDNNCTTIDNFFPNEEINFLKADVEGSEVKLLMGAKLLLSMSKNLKIAICAYHKNNDEYILNSILIENGFHTAFSKGYMIFTDDKELAPPYLRRGLIRAIKKRL
jgi:hypothetical protein